MDVVLVHPEIPQNTGNVARTCAAVGAALHLVHPLGFSVSEKAVRRAGLDYWKLVSVVEHESLTECLQSLGTDRMLFFTSNSPNPLPQAEFPDEPILVFGSETRGLPISVTTEYASQSVRIPTLSEARCLNLSNAVAVGVYDALRRTDYPGLQMSRATKL